jgi:circadian clock protein KaiB
MTYSQPDPDFSMPSIPIPAVSEASSEDKQVKYFLRLFICGENRSSRAALDNLKLLGARLGSCELEIVDVQENPELAELERIVATPTLLRDYPLPRRKIIGDLSDLNTMMLLLSA